MADGRHFETDKAPYLSKDLTYHHKISDDWQTCKNMREHMCLTLAINFLSETAAK